MRLRVESLFALLKSFGATGKESDRAEWASDNEMEWLLNLAMLFVTARAVGHRHGNYTWVMDWAIKLGITRRPSRDDPSPGPNDRAAVEAWEDARDKRFGPPRPPRTLFWDGTEIDGSWRYRMPLAADLDQLDDAA